MNPFLHPHTPTGTITLLRGRVHLRIADIVRLKAEGNYTRFILTDGRQILTSRNISFYEPILAESFVRVHKSYLLNRSYITTLNKHTAQMHDGFVTQISRRKRKKVA